MSKFVNVPRPAPQIGNEFLQQQLDQQAAQPPVPELTAEAGVPPVSSGPQYVPYTGSIEPEMPLPEDSEPDALFGDDIYNQFGQDTTGEVFDDATMGTGRSALDMQGNEMPADQLAAMRQQTLEQQAQGPQSLFQFSKARNEEELSAAFPDAVMPTQAGAIHRASRDIGLALNNLEYSDSSGTQVTGLQRLSEGLGVTTRSAANFNTLSLSLLAPMINGAQEKVANTDIPTEEETSGFAAMESIIDSAEGGLELATHGGGITYDSLVTAEGRLLNGLSKASTAVDPNGLPVNQEKSSRISNEEAGALAVQSKIDSGYYVADTVDGIPVVRLNPLKGAEFYQNSRELQAAVTDTMAGKAQKVAVTDTGDYIGGSRNTRPGDIKKPGFTKTPALQEAKRVAGSIGKMSSVTKGYFGNQLFKTLLEQIDSPDSTSPNGIDALKFFKIDRGTLDKAKAGDEKAQKEIRDKLNLAAGEFFYQAGFMADGSPNYTRYKEDYATHRLYQDPVDFNEQRNKLTRAMMSFSAPAFKLDPTTNYHEAGISRDTAEKFWTRIGEKARGRDFTLTAKERELSFLATLARVLDVGRNVASKTENIPIPDMMRLVDRNFLLNAAFVGEQLRSLVPTSKKAVLNDILNVAAKVDVKNNNGRKKIPGTPDDVTPAFGDVTESQQRALDTWLNNSDRETWGYTLQGYLDAADYMRAKKEGTAFNPKTTVALDMNSAGRAFLAMDVGNVNILNKVGLIWEAYADREYQDVGANGDPRAYFTRIAKEQGVKAAFGDSDQEKVQRWTTLLDKYGGAGARDKQSARKFNSALAKKVLLTTDYGKPMNFHLDEARAFLKEYPDFQSEMMSYYNGDYKVIVKDLNQIFSSTLRVSGDSWQYSLPKQIVKTLQMFGRTPKPAGFYGEPISVGRFGHQETDDYFTIRSKGDTKKIQRTRVAFDPEAAAASKTIMDEDGMPMHYVPGPGTAAINQIGPVMGQYRESIVIAEAMAYINGGKDPAKMLNMSPVFDNFIVDANSYLFTLAVANNIVVPKVMKWDMAASFKDDYLAQQKEVMAELKKAGPEIVIDPKSPYKGAFTVLDREYQYLEGKSDKELSKSQKAFKEFLESPQSGYIPKADRPETFTLKTDQLARMYVQTFKFFGLGNEAGSNKVGKLSRWTDNNSKERKKRAEALEKILSNARRGNIYFFT
jgi:hypothetical protein